MSKNKNEQIEKIIKESQKNIKKYNKFSKRTQGKQRMITSIVLVIVAAISVTFTQTVKKEDVSQVPKVSLDSRYVPVSRRSGLTKRKLDKDHIKVIDGDTFKDDEGNKYRLLLVDAPESCALKEIKNANADGTCKEGKKEEKNGKEASYYLRDIVNSSSSLTIEYDKQKRDKYGRYLVWLFLNDKYLVQSMIVDNGLIDGFYNNSGTFKESSKKIKGMYEPYKNLVSNLER